MQHSETVEIRGHLLDTGVLSRCVDDVLSLGGDYVIEKFDVGRDHEDESYARIRIDTADDGPARLDPDAAERPRREPDRPGRGADRARSSSDGVFPDDFYSTTNLDTQVRLGGHWVDVEQPEMDCGLVVTGEGADARVRTHPGQRRPRRRPDRLRRRRRAGRAAGAGRRSTTATTRSSSS